MAMWMCIDYRELNKLTSPKIDLRSGYHRVTVIGEDVLKTASRSRYGCFEFVVMMFALANAPMVFMDLMNRVCGPKLDGSVIVITHDILIYSKIKGEHAKLWVEVLETLRKEKLYSKFSKGDSSGKFQRLPPRLGVFLGLAGYHRWFIQDFSKIAVSSMRLKCRSVKFCGTWSGNKLVAENFCKAPVLILPEGIEDMTVYCDASYHGLGCVLIHRGKRWWLDVVKDYDCEILYHLSKANVVVNKLSRKAHSVWDLKTDYGRPGLKRVVARYVKEMMARHGVLVTEVPDREERFISRFWGRFYEGMGTRLQFCTAFYPHIDGQNERARQTLEIMLRAGKVDQCGLGSTKRVQKTMEGMEMIRERLQTAQSHQRSYADKLRKCLVDESDHIPASDIQMGELWEANCRVGKEDQNVAEQRDGTSESPMGTSQGVRVDVGVKRRDECEFPELF
ncbi:hypothetical protein OSB04_032231 [Centaurea solstitialis]|uniref:Reverse transcriptase domain-containing protein n=1 Tax=Centaurea solstitialis TaxID=347529 RepID=A0AA38SW75_9ASTR|nr:hypothetical protein OSB04_032231 [Centaurea solstitialis]